MDICALIKNLEKPKSKIDLVLDTDAYNEIDDQFGATRSNVKHTEKALA